MKNLPSTSFRDLPSSNGFRVFSLLFALWTMCPSAALPAQELNPLGPWLGMGFAVASVDEVGADTMGIGTRGYGLNLDLGVLFYEIVSVRLGGELLSFSDEARFSQSTTAGEKESSVGGAIYFVAVGLRTPIFPRPGDDAAGIGISLGADVGASGSAISRGITYCEDCMSEDVTLETGAFSEFSVTIGKEGARVRASYRMYEDRPGLQSVFALGVTLNPKQMF